MTTRTATARAADLTAQTVALAHADGKTIRAIAEHAGITPGAFEGWSRENGKHSPYLGNIVAVLNAIGYTLEIVPIEQRIVP